MKFHCFPHHEVKSARIGYSRARRFALTAGALLILISTAVIEAKAQTAAQKRASVPPPPPGPTGIWYDDTGQGAVEILPCGDRLCGRIVWLQETLSQNGQPLTDELNPDPRLRNRPICGLQVIGDLKLQAGGVWDQGWIYDPKEGKTYDVEIRLRSPDQLQVKGYLGVKFLSETFIWQRAPAEIQRCAATAALPTGRQATAR